MYAPRTAVRASRAIRSNAIRRNVRFASDNASSSSSSFSSPAVMGAVGGAGAAVTVFLAWYQFSGVGKAAATASQMKSYVDKATEKLQVQFKEQTPDASEALATLRSSALKYAAFIPGGKEYVEKVFNDINVIKKKHGDDVDRIVNEAYGDLRTASKKGLTMETAYETWDVLQKHVSALAGLAVDAGQDLVDNHPQLKEKLGGQFDQLKEMRDSMGPEVKQHVDDAYKEIADVLKGGIGFGTIEKIRSLVQDKVQQARKLGDQAWDKGYEQVRPMLEKSPQVKELVEKNLDTLKQGNVTEALSKVKDAVSYGNSGDLEKYIQSAKDKTQQFSSGSLQKWLDMVPNGSQILPQLQKLRQLAEEQGHEAEQLAKDTLHDLMQVLDRRSSEAEKLVEQAAGGKKK
nr:hypothetical protein CFP56_63015 [Quercus suber]